MLLPAAHGKNPFLAFSSCWWLRHSSRHVASIFTQPLLCVSHPAVLELLPPVLPTWESPRSQTQIKSPLGHTSLPTLSAFLGAAKDLQSCKSPHSSQACRKSAAPVQLPMMLSASQGGRDTAHRTSQPPRLRSLKALLSQELSTLLNGNRRSSKSPDHQGLEWREERV